jgi:hypothetical protein
MPPPSCPNALCATGFAFTHLLVVVLEEVDEGEVGGGHGLEVLVLLLERLEHLDRLLELLVPQEVQGPDSRTTVRRQVTGGTNKSHDQLIVHHRLLPLDLHLAGDVLMLRLERVHQPLEPHVPILLIQRLEPRKVSPTRHFPLHGHATRSLDAEAPLTGAMSFAALRMYWAASFCRRFISWRSGSVLLSERSLSSFSFSSS